MSHPATRMVEQVTWKPGLAGEYPGQQAVLSLPDTNVEMIFCWCPPTPPDKPFVMGSPPDEPERSGDEKQRKVEIRTGFWIAQNPVNQQQWRAGTGNDPSQRGKGEDHPVDSVSWNDAKNFCQKTGLRLPTEAEWEYACRAGTSTPFGIGTGGYLNSQMANFGGKKPYGSGREAFNWLYRERTLPQGSFPPNAWGLHDLHGQLWEWCEDLYDKDSGVRVLRGGGWFVGGGCARSASRYGFDPEGGNASIGFRPCPCSTKPVKAAGRESAAERGKE